MAFKLTSPKAIKALLDTFKNIGHLQSRLASSVVEGTGTGVSLQMSCAHEPVAITLTPEFSALTLEEQAAALTAALVAVKAGVDEKIHEIAGPLADILVRKSNSQTS